MPFSSRERARADGKWVSRVFADGFNDPRDGAAGGLFGFKGDVWFSCIPSGWRLRDKGGTGVSNQREAVHRGLRNPKEVAFDRFGNLFSVDNDPWSGGQARIVQVGEGGRSGWDLGHENLSISGSVCEHPPKNRSGWYGEGWWRKNAGRRPGALPPPAYIFTKGLSGLTHIPGTGFASKKAPDVPPI